LIISEKVFPTNLFANLPSTEKNAYNSEMDYCAVPQMILMHYWCYYVK